MRKLMCLLLVLSVVFLAGCGDIIQLEDFDFLLPIPTEKDYSSYPQISSIIELRDFVLEQQSQDVLEFSFVYTKTEPLPEDIFTRVSEVCFVSYSREGEGPFLYEVELFEYPGNRIVDAYFSQDTTNLNEKEQKALEVAVEMVEDAKEKAENDWELEMLLYAALADKITYYSSDMSYESPEEQPWYLNAVGALTMGAANCQGYADAFYTVASIAGFEVGRMGVETPEDPHMVNTIRIDGQWYVVDVTYGDSEGSPVDYRLLNAGLDMIGEYWWSEEVERRPISASTNPQYYYYLRNDIVFDTPEETAQYIAETWDATSQECVYAMLQNYSEGEILNDYLYDALVKLDKSFSYSYDMWYTNNERDSFFAVVFEKTEE